MLSVRDNHQGSATWLNSTNRAKVQTSRIYKVISDGGGSGFEVTCVEGEHFPPTRSDKGAHYELIHSATHSHKHSELGCGDRQRASPREENV